MQGSGVTLKELREKAGVGKEPVRRALYGDGMGIRSARAIAAVLGRGLSEDEVRALEGELREPPAKEILKKSRKGV